MKLSIYAGDHDMQNSVSALVGAPEAITHAEGDAPDEVTLHWTIEGVGWSEDGLCVTFPGGREVSSDDLTMLACEVTDIGGYIIDAPLEPVILSAEDWNAFLANDPTHADIVRMVGVLAGYVGELQNGTVSLDLIHPSGERHPIDVSEEWDNVTAMLNTWSGVVDSLGD